MAAVAYGVPPWHPVLVRIRLTLVVLANETQAARRYLLVAAGIVERPLQSTMNSADRQAIRLVDVRDRTVVLSFAILHHHTVVSPVAVHRKPGTPP
jgi:hypothetical protein